MTWLHTFEPNFRIKNEGSSSEAKADKSSGKKHQPGSQVLSAIIFEELTRSSQLLAQKSKSTGLIIYHNYHDHCTCTGGGVNDDNIPIQANRLDQMSRSGRRRKVMCPFPIKLHQMLSNAEADAYAHIVSWQPHGRCFKIHQPKLFIREVMPRWFKQSKLSSFQRQLNLYGFFRLTRGRDRGAYYNEYFLRGHSNLCEEINRVRIKGTGVKAASCPSTEPNFYTMKCCGEDPNLFNAVSCNMTLESEYSGIDTDYRLVAIKEMGETFFQTFASDKLLTADIQSSFDAGFCLHKDAEPFPSGIITLRPHSDLFAPETLFLDVDTARSNDDFVVDPPSEDLNFRQIGETEDLCMMQLGEMFFEGRPFHFTDPSLLQW